MPQSGENQRQHSDATRARANTHTHAHAHAHAHAHTHTRKEQTYGHVWVCARLLLSVPSIPIMFTRVTMLSV